CSPAVGIVAGMAATGVARVVVMVQENHTTDNYLRGLAPYGVNVATDWPIQPNPPASDQPHDRHAYYRWLSGQRTATHTQFDTDRVLPYYAYLGLTGALLENHCSGFGTNSTPNHLLLVGGQTPTLRNPPRSQPAPLWDMPSAPGLASEHGISWRCYTASDDYPVGFYTQLKGSANLVSSDRFITDAAAGMLPRLCYLWHDSPRDEHPVADVTIGQNAIREAVDAVVQGGGWDSTVFLLTWDDWGGWDDHVATPNIEYTPDGVQLAYGPRVPLLMFGGPVAPRIDSRWCSHVSIPKTALQLLGLPALGVSRLDEDPGLADLVDPTHRQPPPPAPGSPITLPAPPQPARPPQPPPPPPPGTPQPVGPVRLRNGKTLPPPNDTPIKINHIEA
ncbi:MAG: alkaline phosphatase family protein, partial [Pseudonocardiaceae bacterium]